MGSKSQVRSMQRGAQVRDREKPDDTPDYAGKAPSIRPEDRMHLGLTDEAFDRFARSLRDKVLGYARAGYKKPADVSRLLNKERVRTLAGTDWNPRIAHFLLGRIYGLTDNRPTPSGTPRKLPNTVTKVGSSGTASRPLSQDEISRRLAALKASVGS